MSDIWTYHDGEVVGHEVRPAPVREVNADALRAKAREVYADALTATTRLQTIRNRPTHTGTTAAQANAAIVVMQSDVQAEALILQGLISNVVALGRLALGDLDSTEGAT